MVREETRPPASRTALAGRPHQYQHAAPRPIMRMSRSTGKSGDEGSKAELHHRRGRTTEIVRHGCLAYAEAVLSSSARQPGCPARCWCAPCHSSALSARACPLRAVPFPLSLFAWGFVRGWQRWLSGFPRRWCLWAMMRRPFRLMAIVGGARAANGTGVHFGACGVLEGERARVTPLL